MVSLKPSLNGCDKVDNEFYIKKNYIYSKGKQNGVSYEYEVIGLEQKQTIINFNAQLPLFHRLAYPDILAQNYLLRPIMELKLMKEGVTMLHAGSTNGHVTVGRGGCGKTTKIMEAVKLGEPYEGDDWIIC